MGRLLNFFLGKDNRHKCAAYPHIAALFEGLKQEAPRAISCLYAKISGSIARIGQEYSLTEEDIEELIGDCIALLLLKIRNGQYVFQGYDPATYVVEIAKNKVRHFKKSRTNAIDSIADTLIAPEYTTAESVELLDKLLARLPENCQKLIRLKYLDEIRDKDIIDQKLTQYTTVDALKNHRAQCMKKLVALGAETLLLN